MTKDLCFFKGACLIFIVFFLVPVSRTLYEIDKMRNQTHQCVCADKNDPDFKMCQTKEAIEKNVVEIFFISLICYCDFTEMIWEV